METYSQSLAGCSVNFGKKEEGRRKKEEGRRDWCQLKVKCSTDRLFDDDCPEPLRVGGNRSILFSFPS
ncbi:hypothetical protein QUA43_06800 [Microcoleus sp. N9_B4]